MHDFISVILFVLAPITKAQQGQVTCLSPNNCITENVYCTTNATLLERIGISHDSYFIACIPLSILQNHRCLNGKSVTLDHQLKMYILTELFTKYLPLKTNLDIFFEQHFYSMKCNTFNTSDCTQSDTSTLPTVKPILKSPFLLNNVYSIENEKIDFQQNILYCPTDHYFDMFFLCMNEKEENNTYFEMLNRSNNSEWIRNEIFKTCLPVQGVIILSKPLDVLFKVGYGISSFCLLLHILSPMFYHRRIRHPYNLLLGMSTFILFYQILHLIIIEFKGNIQECLVLFAAYRFVFFCQYLWMNVTAYDAWKIFRKTDGNYQKHKIGYYLMYTVGLSMSICGGDMLVMNLTNKYSLFHYRHLHNSCFVARPWSTFIFYLIPVFIIFGMNIIFFFITAKNIRSTTNHILIQKAKKTGVSMYARLAILFGMNWLLNIVADTLREISNHTADIIQYMALLFTVPQGPLMLWYFGFSSNTKLKLTKGMNKCSAYMFKKQTEVEPENRL